MPTELTSPIFAVSLFCQYLCSGAPVRSHSTICCPLYMDHAQVTIQPGKSQRMHVNLEVAGSNPALVNVSLFIQSLSKMLPSQFPLWFIIIIIIIIIISSSL